MKQLVLYQYIGDNGTITTPVRLEGIPSIKVYQIAAEDGKVLTKNGKAFYSAMMVAPADLKNWKEVDKDK